MNEEFDENITLCVDLGNGILADMSEKEYDDYLKRKKIIEEQKEPSAMMKETESRMKQFEKQFKYEIK